MARAFHFSLQKVLDVRRHREKQRKIELSKANRKLLQEQSELDKLNIEKEAHLNIGSTNGDDTPDLNTLKVNGSYLRQLSEQISAQRTEVKKTEKKTEERREELIEAVKKKKIVEKLRERKMEDYRQDLVKQEQKKDNEAAVRITNQKRQKE